MDLSNVIFNLGIYLIRS